jgi:hypothetical protein
MGLLVPDGFASNVGAPPLEGVSTVRGSGGVDDSHAILRFILNREP